MPRYLTLLLTCWSLMLVGPVAQAQTTINQDMIKAGNAMSALVPYLYNDARFRQQENHDFILQQLNDLISAVEAEPRLLKDHAVSRLISQSSLLEQLKQAKLLFNTGNYASAQYLLGNAPVLCSSCHIQDGIAVTSAPKVRRDQFANDFDYAEFNYFVRNYSVAARGYLDYLNRSDIRKSRVLGAKALRRLLDITLITDHNLDTSQEKLQQYSEIKDLNLELKQHIDAWQKGINVLKESDLAHADIEKQIYSQFKDGFNLKHEFIFDETKRPLALAWRGELQRRMQSITQPDQVARNLYLIAILERLLGDQSELSLANLYLKECIHLKVPTYSEKCMNEYEGHVYFYYGGSAGENLPVETQEELSRLRRSLSKSI